MAENSKRMNGRTAENLTRLGLSGFILSLVLVLPTLVSKAGEKAGESDAMESKAHQVASQNQALPIDIDSSPLPTSKGAFVSLGARGKLNGSETKSGFVQAGLFSKIAPPANCSAESIIYYAERAPESFDNARNGTLYGVKTHISATRVGEIEGYNACALVAHAILKRAGCSWARYTASAKALYDMAWKKGWRPSRIQKAGCLVAWNSRAEGWRPRIGRGIHKPDKGAKKVRFRHVGITTGTWMAMDNTSLSGRPSAGVTLRPIRYEAPMFLCPPRS